MNHLKVVLAGLLAGASMVSVPAFASSLHEAQPQCEGEKGDKGDKGTSKPAPAPAPKPPAAR